MVLDDAVRDLLHQHRLARLRRRDDEAALALADGRHQVHQPHRQVARLVLQLEPLFRVARPQVVEGDAVLGLVRIVAVDLLDLQQREVALALLGRADLAHDRVARAQVETLDLRRADVDVVGSVQVVPVLRAQEAVALRQDLQHALAAQDDIAVEQVLFDAEDQVLLTQARVVRDVELLCHFMELGNGLALQLGDVHE
jgi:hypothetical protein